AYSVQVAAWWDQLSRARRCLPVRVIAPGLVLDAVSLSPIRHEPTAPSAESGRVGTQAGCAPGFSAPRLDRSVPGGRRVTEVWDSQADFEAWFESNVKPAFAEGGPMPSITFDELNEVLTA